MAAVKEYKLGFIHLWDKSVEELVKEGFFEKGATLAELWKAYSRPSTGVRDSVHSRYYGQGEWLADVVETNGAKFLRNGYLRIIVVQRPDDVVKYIKSGKYVAIGGKRRPYDCPPSGYVVPGDGFFRHPDTGLAIATVKDREKAVKLNAEFIEKNPNKFAGWKIPKIWHDFLSKKYEQFNPEKPTPEQLAEVETSYQHAPWKDSGFRIVCRGFANLSDGPLCVYLNDDLHARYPGLGARVRIKNAVIRK